MRKRKKKVEKVVPLRGTELSELAKEFLDSQEKRVQWQLRIIAEGKLALNHLNQEKLKLLERWIKEKKSFENFILPWLKEQLSARWSLWREERYLDYLQREKAMLALLEKQIANRAIWREWLSKVRGVGVALAGQVIGGFESALGPGETLGSHFKSVSQMNAFAGLDVDPETGQARKRVRGKKSKFNSRLRSILIGRLGASLIKQGAEKSGYRRLYDEFKTKLRERFQREGIKIVPSNRLPKKEGKVYEPEGTIAEGHLHMMALRKMVKIFVSHFWEMERKVERLPAGKPYVISIRHHPPESYIPPIFDKEEE